MSALLKCSIRSLKNTITYQFRRSVCRFWYLFLLQHSYYVTKIHCSYSRLIEISENADTRAHLPMLPHHFAISSFDLHLCCMNFRFVYISRLKGRIISAEHSRGASISILRKRLHALIKSQLRRLPEALINQPAL